MTDLDSVVIPSSQKSWIGKAIFVSEKVHLTRWNAAEGAAVESADKNQDEDKNLWYMLTGTPATCASIGIHHLSKTKPDLLLSGPNYGRNTSSLAALSSGTLGAALEGVGAGVRGIAVSYAIWPKSSQPEWIEAATKWTIRLARHLYENWDEGVDLYSINGAADSFQRGALTDFIRQYHFAKSSWTTTARFTLHTSTRRSTLRSSSPPTPGH